MSAKPLNVQRSVRKLFRGRQPVKDSYKTIIVGGGAHGLSLAYNLAKRGSEGIAVFEKGYIGCGASGRNTAFARSSYSNATWIRFYTEAITCLEHLSSELDYNVMFAQRGHMLVAYTDEEAEICERGIAQQHSLGLNTRTLSPAEAKELAPDMNAEGVKLILYQPKGGTIRHDAVMWGYQRAAEKLGVEIYPFTPVNKIQVSEGAATSVVTSRGEVHGERVVCAAGGYSPNVARMAGVHLPTKTHRLEALVTESLKPFLDPILVSLHIPSYCSQTDRGEIVAGADLDPESSYKTNSSVGFLRSMCERLILLLPRLRDARVLRQWAGLCEMTEDKAPILGPVPEVDGLILDCGWGSSGFKACAAAGKFLADYMVDGTMPEVIRPFNVERFRKGELILDNTLIAIVHRAKTS